MQRTRSSTRLRATPVGRPQDHLKTFEGVLHADGYAGSKAYDELIDLPEQQPKALLADRALPLNAHYAQRVTNGSRR
jgi:hypothetical protein